MSRRPLFLAVPALALVAGCGSLDTGKGEETIKSEIEKATGAEAVEVNCPDDVEQKKGEDFDCTATVDGQKVTVPVTQTDDEGHVQYNPQLINTLQVAKKAEQLANRRTENTSGAKAQCPVVVPLKQGATFTCDVQTPGPNFKAQVTQTDDQGQVNVKLEP